MNALDQVRPPIGDLQHFAGFCVELHLPMVLTTDLEHPFGGAHVQTIDIVPGLDFRFGDILSRRKNLVEAERRFAAGTLLCRWLNPG